MKTGIKTSAPATISPGSALNNTLFFAINQPRVEIVAKTTDNPFSFLVAGYKKYESDFIKITLEYLYSLKIFRQSKSLHLEINNKIPFGHGFGAHASFFSCLLKAMCVINKVNLNNRELYKYLLAEDKTLLKFINPGKLVSSMDGGCLLVDENTPELLHRIYLPAGLSFIIYISNNQSKEEPLSLQITKNSLIKSIEFVLGLHTSNWEFIKQGFPNTDKYLSLLNLPKNECDILLENMLGLDFNAEKRMYILCCNNSLKAENCFGIFERIMKNKGFSENRLFLSTIDLVGSIIK